MPEEFPFKAELGTRLSTPADSYEVLDICTSEELAKELSAVATTWTIFPLAWHFTDDFDLFQHVVTGMGAAFERRKATRRKEDGLLDDALYGDPLAAGHKAGLKAPKASDRAKDGGSMANRHSGGEADEGPQGGDVDDDDDECPFEGMGKDVVDAICDEFVGEDLELGDDRESESEEE